MAKLYIGTCHWKYSSWVNLVYSQPKGINYLKEYAAKYSTVEIDQWFWSLFKEDQVVLPAENTVQEYLNSVPEDFIFTIKVPNSITLTHFYKKKKTDTLKPNPYFLSIDLFHQFLSRIKPLDRHLGPLMFQFEYLNKLKISGLADFISILEKFFKKIPRHYAYGIEIRNPNYLHPPYFEFLQSLNIACVLLQGYYMPPIVSIYNKYKEYLTDCAVIRLHGPHRGEIEKQAKNRWDKIIIQRDEELKSIVGMINHMLNRNIDVFLNVNNHYEGSSPLTIERIRGLLAK